MKDLLLDTHIWLWYLGRPELLAKNHRRAIEDNIESCWISPVSVWEAVVLMEKGRLRVTVPPRAWIEEALSRFPVQEAALSHEIALLSREVHLPHQDPADRFICATAVTYGLTVLTVDKRLLSAKWLSTLNPR